MKLFDWKICRVCGEELPTTEFSLTHSREGQYRGTCKPCERDKLKRTDAYNKCECGAVKKAESQRCIRCQRLRNTYDPSFIKSCSKCGRKKKAVEFGWRMHKGIKRVRNVCKSCATLESRERREKLTPEELLNRKRKCAKRSRRRSAQDPVYRLARRRSAIRQSCRRLGLGDFQYEIAEQYELTTKCAICGSCPQKQRLHIDHCHATGGFRGFLCSSCNTGIGHFRDSVEYLKSAIQYLERFEKVGR